MKTSQINTLAISALLALATACTTLSPAQQSISLKLVTETSVYYALKKHHDWQPYFTAASVLLSEKIAGEETSPAKIRSALATIVDRNPDAELILLASLDLYDLIAGSLNTEDALPYLMGLRDGIMDAIEFSGLDTDTFRARVHVQSQARPK